MTAFLVTGFFGSSYENGSDDPLNLANLYELTFLTAANPTFLESDNPFLQRLHSRKNAEEYFEAIDDETIPEFNPKGHAYYFPRSHDFSFISYNALFVAFNIVPENQVTSVLAYLDEDPSELRNSFCAAFGKPEVIITIDADATFVDDQTGNVKYESCTWKEGHYVMTLSPYRHDSPAGEQKLRSAIVIRTLR